MKGRIYGEMNWNHCPAHPILFNLFPPNNIWGEYKSWGSLLWNFLRLPVTPC